MKRQTIGDLTMLFVTLCWGLTFPLIENAVAEVNPAVFVVVRFALAACILFPFIFHCFRTPNLVPLLKAGMVLGLLNIGGYLAQTIGLQSLNAAEGAFITGLNVIIVPFLLPLFRLSSIKRIDVVSAGLCLLGLFLLTGAKISHFSEGEMWILLCAFCVALAIVYLQKISSTISNPQDFNLLAFLQIVFTALFSSPFCWGKHFSPILHLKVLIPLLFCSVIATCGAMVLQTKYQHYTTASRAAMIFCLEPLFASIFGYMINGETLSQLAWIGGALIILSIMGSEIYRFYITTSKTMSVSMVNE